MRLVLPILLVIACGKRSPAIDGECSAGAATAGESGAVALDSVDLDWTYSRKEGLSWAGPVEFMLADDITSFAITIDGGTMPTGISWLTNDGTAIMDGSGDTSWGDPARSAARAETDAWDTSGWDTADSGWIPDGWGWGAEPMYHYPVPAGTVRMPLSSATEPAPGCLRFLAVVEGDQRDEVGRAHLLTKRSPATDDALNVNLVLMDGAGISEAEVWEAYDDMFRIYAAGDGPSEGTVEMWLDGIGGGATRVAYDSDAMHEMRSRDYGGEHALNIFFIQDFDGESGTLGIAAGIPGPMGIQGTAGSGVIITVDTHLDGDGNVDTALMGGTMAHELGHQLGLFHSTEAGGDGHDVIEDTPECDAATYDTDGDGYVTAEECADADGANFMFWTAGELVQEDISPQQAAMLDASPPAQ